MLVTQIIGYVVFIISLILAIIAILFCFLKNIGATYYGFSTLFIYFAIPLFPFLLEQIVFVFAPDVWGLAYIFIGMNILFLFIPYGMLDGDVILGRKNIYRLNSFLIPKKYSYEDVIRYRMKYSSGIVHLGYGPSKVITYNFEIYFNDGEYSVFCVKRDNDRKVSYIKSILEEKRCKKNGKVKECKKKF